MNTRLRISSRSSSSSAPTELSQQRLVNEPTEEVADSDQNSHSLPDLQAKLERASRFGHNFSQVQVSADSAAIAQPKPLIAHSFEQQAEVETNEFIQPTASFSPPIAPQSIQRQLDEEEFAQARALPTSLTPVLQRHDQQEAWSFPHPWVARMTSMVQDTRSESVMQPQRSIRSPQDGVTDRTISDTTAIAPQLVQQQISITAEGQRIMRQDMDAGVPSVMDGGVPSNQEPQPSDAGAIAGVPNPLLEELERLWASGDKGAFFSRLRTLDQPQREGARHFVELNLRGDDLWLAQNIISHGLEANWPIHLRVEREMKGWGDCGGKGAVFEILRAANGTQAGNAQLTASLHQVFAAGSDDLWLGQNLQAHGLETNWPIHLRIEREMKGWNDSGGSLAVLNLITNATQADMSQMASEVSISEALQIFAYAGVPCKRQFELVLNVWSANLSHLRPLVEGATDSDRQTVWSDTALMNQAHTALGEQDYLTLVTLLRMFQVGTTAHTSAADADTAIQTHLAAYVTDAVTAGRQISGMVAVVGDADWDRAGIAHYGAVVWNSGKRDQINGFVDSPGRVWIHRDRGNAGTMIHEAIHKYSNNALIQISQPLNEGVTEYFTRKVCAALTPPITGRTNYQNNYNCVVQLASLVSEATLASAYFNGDTVSLQNAFVLAKSLTDWTNFINKTIHNQWADAIALCIP